MSAAAVSGSRAIEQIKSLIAEGRLRPGERLPTEREFAARLGISRSSMREAIRALTVLGVLEARHGSGIYVTRLEAGELLETLGVVADLSRGPQLVELLEIRRLLESAAAAIAAARITPEQLDEVRVHLDAMYATEEPGDILAHDLAFHRAIAAATGNATLVAVLEGLSSRSFRARVWRGYRQEGAFDRTRHEHARIHQAREDRDPEAARAAAASHVRGVEDWLRSQLD
ncbi:FCD domain-containing protein [Streptomyces sp. B6B3]|uniref:FadR/GntR family transcriptional regulator n=1 Tax=Streptomyces sp. B6B3 TaxID=3153570 RepID=UPI00325D6602